MQKLLFLVCLLAGALPSLAQRKEITNRNYYDYYVGPTSMRGDVVGPIAKLKSRKLGTSWLQREEITPILVEEMTKAGYNQVYPNKLFRLDSAHYVLLGALAMNATQLGFLYAQGHAAFPVASDRLPGHQLMGDGQYEYVQLVSAPGNQTELIKIRKLPANLFALQENWYWYQYTDNASDNNYLLTKEDILRVLRADIQEKLATAPQPVTR